MNRNLVISAIVSWCITFACLWGMVYCAKQAAPRSLALGRGVTLQGYVPDGVSFVRAPLARTQEIDVVFRVAPDFREQVKQIAGQRNQRRTILIR